jgi:integrase
MRPGEVVIMRPCDIDQQAGQTWVYRPESHKTEHHNITRVIFLGPRAQAILRTFLEGRAPDAFLFSPREAIEARHNMLRRQRRTKVQPSQLDRRKARPRKVPGDRYTVASYDRAISAACDKAAVARWTPNQLRHTKATEIRRAAGLDAARAVLGHRSPHVTEVYAELDENKAAEIMAQLG